MSTGKDTENGPTAGPSSPTASRTLTVAGVPRGTPLGQKEHVRSEKIAQDVLAYATVGVPHNDIARLVGMAPATVAKYYQEELLLGKARGNAVIAGRLYAKASRGELAACIFWLKAQAGWRETSIQQTQQLDRDGKPMDPPKLGISFGDGGPGRHKSMVETNEAEPPVEVEPPRVVN